MSDLARFRQRGFTIIEVMVSLAIAAVLIGLALPAFNAFTEQRRLTSQVNDFMVAIQYARSEAGRQGTTVSLQSMNAADDTDEWGEGYCVVVGNPGDCAGVLLRRFDPIGNNTLNADGVLDSIGTLSFNARGLLIGLGAGTVDLCHPVEETGRRISLSAIGRVSSNELDCIP